MKLNDFHKIFCNHLSAKPFDVSRIMAMETNNEKWFQGEMALAFSKRNQNYNVFSSEVYNNWTDECDEAWEKRIKEEKENGKEKGLITCEASVYKNVKTEKSKSSGLRKVDILLERKDTVILCEMKILWLDFLDKINIEKNFEEAKDALYNYMLKKKALDDAWRLCRGGVYKKLKSDDSDALKSYLSFICAAESELKDFETSFRNLLVATLNKYLKNPLISDQEKWMQLSKIYNYSTRDWALCDEKEGTMNIYLVTVELKNKNRR